MRRSHVMAMISAAVCAALPGCGDGELIGPPEVRVGRDECAECGMLLAEDRSACALLVDDRGYRRHLVFDDPGCQLDYRTQNAAVHVVEAYMRDFGSGQWMTADQATFVFADPEKLVTPMGSGIAAFATEPSAEAKRQVVGGEILNYQHLSAARREWKEARLGRGRTPPDGTETPR